MIYDWECPVCGSQREIVASISHRNDPQICAVKHAPTAMQRVMLKPPIGIVDIEPYQAVAGDRAGMLITSRQEHREYLRRNRLIEVGTDKPKDTRQMRTKPMTRDERAHLRAQIRDELRRKVPREILEKRG